MPIASPEIIIVGPQVNCDITLAEMLEHEGFRCTVVRPVEIGTPDLQTLPAPLKFMSADKILFANNSFEMYQICRRAKCVITFTGVLPFFLRYFWLALPALPFPPIINISTGSDLTELAVEKSKAGFMYRQLLRRAAFTAVPPYPNAIKNVRKLRPKNYMMFKFPFFLPNHRDHNPVEESKIVYLHASHLDWGQVDNKPGRNSTKGNDRFIRAFISAAREGAPIRCKILDRGSDRLAARELIESLGATDLFEWISPVTQKELGYLIQQANVIVDQFDVGGFGCIAMESMALSVPVMIYIDEACTPLAYGEEPPILNCTTEAEIKACILSNQDRKQLHDLGKKAESWVRRNHDIGSDISEFLLRLCVAANIEWPRPKSA